MPQHLLIILLTSGWIAFCSCHNYDYYLINMNKDWDEAQLHCREMDMDLAIISSPEDMEQVVALVETSKVNSEMWIGLKEAEPASWLWTTSASEGVAKYTNWATSPASTHQCGAMRDDGKWVSALCTTALPFVCKEDEASQQVHVVLQNSTWRQAQDYCRQHYRDLANVWNEEQNQLLQQIIHERNSLSLFWMGLFRDDWKWSDQSNISFRFWSVNQPNKDGTCALYSPVNNGWMDRGCTYMFPFLCSVPCVVIPKLQRTVRMKTESHPLIDFNDPTVSEAILTQIQSKLEGVKVQWNVQSDGKIFHREDEESDCSSCNNVL